MHEQIEVSSWIDLPLNEKYTILANIAEEKAIKDNAVEKDFWVSMVLKALFSLSYSDKLVFKGGTSLSKGWNLIERFSEDCDLAIDRNFLGFEGELSRKQRTSLRKASKVFIENTLSKDLVLALNSLGLEGHFKIKIPTTTESDKDPVEFFVEYDSCLTDKDPYIPERVKIEVSCRSLLEPFELIFMCSMIEEAYPDESFSSPKFSVPTVLPGRTFLEKVFLLHEEFNRLGGCTHLERLTRHMYDIEKMMDKEFAFQAMNNVSMYVEIVKHRQSLTAWKGLDYKLHKPGTLSFIPPSFLNTVLKEDYSKMQEGFIYGDSLSYEDLISRLSGLQQYFKELTWSDPFFEDVSDDAQVSIGDNTNVRNVNKCENNLSVGVNSCKTDSDVVNYSVNVDELTALSIAHVLVSEFISGVSDRIATRMAEEVAAIYVVGQLTKRELKEQLDLSEEQIKIDLRELTRAKLLEQKGKEKKFMLSEKAQIKISSLYK